MLAHRLHSDDAGSPSTQVAKRAVQSDKTVDDEVGETCVKKLGHTASSGRLFSLKVYLGNHKVPSLERVWRRIMARWHRDA